MLGALMNLVTKSLLCQLGAAIMTIFLVVLVACHGASASTESEQSRNIAADTVRYVETGATCEPGFSQPQLHSARCTLPGGVKIYCTASSTGWACAGLTPAQPQTPARVPPPQVLQSPPPHTP